MITLSFFGACDTVTGSRYLLRTANAQVLVECGLFQGYKQLRLRNRAPFPVPPGSIDAVVLTHAHIDHTGYLPALVRDGFKGPVYATPPTCDLCRILLPDSGHLQEEEAAHALRHGYSRHARPEPLYTQAAAEASLDSLRPAAFGVTVPVAPGVEARFRRAGHIPGAASLELGVGDVRLVFSGDLGRLRDPLLPSPERVAHADYLVVESTYGDRLHSKDDVQEALGEIVRQTARRGGVLLIPAFAVGRTQALLYHLHALRQRGVIPALPTFLDSPMAARATRLLQQHAGEHRLSRAEYDAVLESVTITGSVEESKAIGRRNGPMIVIAASGMLTGGRILHHVARFGGDHRNTVLLPGYQAGGTRGDELHRGGRMLKIHGRFVRIAADVIALDGLSAHADADEIMDWLRSFEVPPRRTFVTHGEPHAADTLRRRIQAELGWTVGVPEHMATVELSTPALVSSQPSFRR